MSTELILANARIVLDDEVVHGSVRVRDDVIADIATGPTSAPDSLDLEGDYLLPGLVELHTDNLEKHLTPRPKVRWPVTPALMAHDTDVSAAGITTVFDAVRVGDTSEAYGLAERVREILDHINTAREHGILRAEHLIHLRCEIGGDNAAEMFDEFRNDPLVRLVSIMDHTPGQRQFRNLEHWKIYYQGKYGLDDDGIAALVAERKERQARNADRNQRAIVAACRDRDLVLASHDDTTAEHIDEAVEIGATISEFPTTVEAAAAAQAHNLGTIAGAPNVVRGGSHSGNVAALELAERGLLDALSSDYVPASLLHSAFIMHDRLDMTLPDAVNRVARNPARMVDLDDRGEIAVGKRADLVRVDNRVGVPVVRQVWRQGQRVV